MAEELFRNVNQVVKHLRDLGYTVAYNTVKKHIEDGAIRPRQGGGWTARQVEAYARNVWSHKRAADASPEADTPDVDIEPGAAEERTRADARLKTLQAERAELNLERERGNLIQRRDVDSELAARMAFFAAAFEGMAVDMAQDVVALLGGENLSGLRKMIEIAGGDRARASDLDVFLQSMIPDIAEAISNRKRTLLSAWSRGEMHTEAMEAAMGRGTG